MRVHYTTTLPQPSIRAAGFVIVGPAGLLEAQQYHRRCAVLSRYDEFSDILTRVREPLGGNFRPVNTRIARAAVCLCINSARRIFARLYARARLPGVFRRLCACVRKKHTAFSMAFAGGGQYEIRAKLFRNCLPDLKRKTTYIAVSR